MAWTWFGSEVLEWLKLTGVLLLGHQRGTSRVCVRQADETEFQTAVDDQILGPARDLQHERATPLHGFHGEVTVTDSVHGVVQQIIEAELLSHSVTVNLERVTSESTTSERATVNASNDLTQTLQLTSESRGVRQHPVGPTDGLGLLEVSVAGHKDVNVLLGAGDGDLDEVTEVGVENAQLITQPETHVSSDLLVARAAGVQLAANLLANDLAESTLVGGVDVLVVLLGFEGVGAPFLGNLLETALDLGELLRGQDAVVHVGAGEGN